LVNAKIVHTSAASISAVCPQDPVGGGYPADNTDSRRKKYATLITPFIIALYQLFFFFRKVLVF
jgi:hypothetical protein